MIKKENIFRIFLMFGFIVLTVFAVIRMRPVETGILSGFLNPQNELQKQLIELSDISSSTLNVIIESQYSENIENTKDELFNLLNKTNIKKDKFNSDRLLEIYSKYPNNFISYNRRQLLKNKNYKELSQISLEQLYNPLGFFIQTPDKDPYLFATDYVLNLQNPYFDTFNNTKEFNGKYYSKIFLKVTNPKTLNKDLKTLIKFQQKCNKKEDIKVYLTGTPIHTFVTSHKSSFEINIICIISFLLIMFICKKYFNSLKIFIPILLSISFGLIVGYLTTIVILGQMHVLTIVFATSLIGISLDYSFHYIISELKNINIIKSLTVSMLTTVVAFLLLLFSGVELLKQIGIYTASGLVGVYLFVILILPMLKNFYPKTTGDIKLPNISKYRNILVLVIVIVSIIGFCRIKTSDDIRTLYIPQKKLLQAEILNNKVFKMPEITFITIKGNSVNKIIEQEEFIGDKLNKDGILYFSLAQFLPSAKRQMENRQMVKDLYQNNLDNYANFLDLGTQNSLKKASLKNDVQDFTKNNNDVLKNFMLDKNTSYMIVFGKYKPLTLGKNINQIKLADNISQIMKSIRIKFVKILPFIFLIYFILLSICYKPLKAVKIISAPLIASIFAIGFTSLIGQQIDIFHILSIFLILGFSLDYSIFMANGGKESKDAVFISFISTFISFTLLAFTSFKLISSMGIILAIGLLTSYLLGLAFFLKKE